MTEQHIEGLVLLHAGMGRRPGVLSLRRARGQGAGSGGRDLNCSNQRRQNSAESHELDRPATSWTYPGALPQRPHIQPCAPPRLRELCVSLLPPLRLSS